MPRSADKSEFTEAELAELSALADGTLDPARRPEVEARIKASSELSALYERERAVVAVLHESRRTVRAPARLRARIEVTQRPRRRLGPRRMGYAGAFVGAVAGMAAALLLILPAGTPGSPSVSQAAGLAVLGPTAPAPAPDPRTPAKLQTNIEDVYFPNWSGRFGWHAVGQRTDRIDGRVATTVYYESRGQRVAYTIVGAPALAAPAAQVSVLNGTVLRTLVLHGQRVVTWRRARHTCVLSSAGARPRDLQRLAAWQAPGISA